MNEINVSTTPTNEGKRDELKEAKKDENENESNMRLLINSGIFTFLVVQLKLAKTKRNL